MYFEKQPTVQPMWIVKDKNFDFEKDFEERQKLYEKIENDPKAVCPISEFGAVDVQRRIQQFNDEVKLDYERFIKERIKEEKNKK